MTADPMHPLHFAAQDTQAPSAGGLSGAHAVPQGKREWGVGTGIPAQGGSSANICSCFLAKI